MYGEGVEGLIVRGAGTLFWWSFYLLSSLISSPSDDDGTLSSMSRDYENPRSC